MRQLTLPEVARLLGEVISVNAQYYLGTCQGAQSGQVFQVEGRSAMAVQSIPPGRVVLVNSGGQWLAFPPRQEAGNSRVVQQARRRKRGQQPPAVELTYAIGYEVIDEAANRVYFYVAADGFENLVYSTEYKLEYRTTTDQVPPGLYLAIWAYNYPWNIDDLFNGDTIKVRGGSQIYEFQDMLGTASPTGNLFGQDFGSGFFFNPYAITRIPRPADFPAPYFSGEYFIPGLRYITTAWADSPISHTYNTSAPGDWVVNYPAETEFRAIMYAEDSDGTGSNQSFDWAIYEFTGVMFTSESQFRDWDDNDLPVEITSRGFTKADLVRPAGTSGQVYAKVYDIPPGPDGPENSFHLTFGLIPWDEEPGPGYPGQNVLHFTRGPNGYVPIYNDYNFFGPEEPYLVWDGRDYFTPGPVESQVIPTGNTYEWYLSSRNAEIYFFIKEGNDLNSLSSSLTSGSVQDGSFLSSTYKAVDKEGNTKTLSPKPPDEYTAGRGFTDLRALRAVPDGYSEWRWFLTDKYEFFSEVTVDFGEDANSTALGLRHPHKGGDGTKNKVSALHGTDPGAFVEDKFFSVIDSTGLMGFLHGSDKTLAVDVIHTAYTLTYDTENYFAWDLWDSVILSTGNQIATQLEIKEPVKLKKFLDDPSLVTSIKWITPVFSESEVVRLTELLEVE